MILVYANSANFQLYHGENKLIFNEMMKNSHMVFCGVHAVEYLVFCVVFYKSLYFNLYDRFLLD